MDVKYNIKNPGIKRLMREAAELSEPTEEYSAYPLEDNLFEWHFTVRGPPNTEFEEGVYHGRIILPKEYPMKPPDIILLTPNGRFETNKKICLSISGHHPESWQPSWSIRTALLALIAFMPTKTTGAIGSLDYTPEERKILARKSKDYTCQICGNVANKLSEKERKTTLSAAETSLINEITSLADNKNTEICEKAIKKALEEIVPQKESSANRTSTPESLPKENDPDAIEALAAEEPNETQASSNVIPFVIFFLVTTILILVFRRFFTSNYFNIPRGKMDLKKVKTICDLAKEVQQVQEAATPNTTSIAVEE